MFQTKSETTMEPMLLLTRQAAKLLNISERTLWTLTNEGKIPCVRVGRSVRYDPNDLRAWIASAKSTSTGKVAA
jgi:excisionase family DNA binding protein